VQYANTTSKQYCTDCTAQHRKHHKANHLQRGTYRAVQYVLYTATTFKQYNSVQYCTVMYGAVLSALHSTAQLQPSCLPKAEHGGANGAPCGRAERERGSETVKKIAMKIKGRNGAPGSRGEDGGEGLDGGDDDAHGPHEGEGGGHPEAHSLAAPEKLAPRGPPRWA